MKTRIDALCELAALKTTTPAQISDRLLEEKIEIINNTHVTQYSRPVEWAAQTGSFENVRFLIEELHVQLDANVEITRYNILQWSHDWRADLEVKGYLSDLDKKLWRQFQDGTDDLHIFAYKGMTAEVEAIFSQDPDRICELSRERYSPLYWAYLGDQKDMQALLLLKLNEYKQRHADNDEKMFTFHIGMLFATTENIESYNDFDAFLALGKRMSAANFKTRIHFDIILQRYMFDAEHDLTHIYDDLETNDQHTLQRCNAINKQALQANAAITKRTQNDEYKLSALVLLAMQYYELSSSVYLRMFASEMDAPEKNWSRIEEYLNACYSDAEEGILQTDMLSLVDVNEVAKKERKGLIKKLKATQTNAQKEEKNIGDQNKSIKIKPEPLKHLFVMLQNKDKTTEEIVDFIDKNSINVAKFYRYRAAIDHAVLHGRLLVATDLLTIYRDTLAIPVGSKRKNLMQLIRGRDEVSQEMKDFILNPDYRLWELFQDGTTDLHAHAYAGRVEVVLNLLIETPDRYLEINRDGENIFYWAYSSSERATFLDKMDVAEVYKLMLATAERWDDLLKYFHNSQKFMKECLQPKARIELIKKNLEWLEELEGHDDYSGYTMVKDCLRIMFAQAYIDDKKEDVIQYHMNLIYAQDLLKKVVNQTSCADIQFDLAQTFVRSSISRATKYRNEGDYQSSNFEFSNAKKSFSCALESLDTATESLADWPIDLPGKELQTLRIKNLSEEVNIKMVSLVDFQELDAIHFEDDEDAAWNAETDALFLRATSSYSALLANSIFDSSAKPKDNEKLEEQDEEEEKKTDSKPEPQQPNQSRPTM